MLKRVFGNMAWAHLTVTQHVLIKTIFGEKNCSFLYSACHNDPLPPFTSNWIFVKNKAVVSHWPEGQNSEWTFHLVKSYFVENLKENVTRDFYIFTEIWAAAFLTKEPQISEIFLPEAAAAHWLSQYCAVQFSEHDAVCREMHIGTMLLPHDDIPLVFISLFQESRSHLIYFC